MDSNTLPVHLVDFTTDESVVQALRSYVQDVSQRFALELDTLEGISGADDFRGYANKFQTGFGPQDRPDVSDFAVGFTPEVLRDGRLGSHVILQRSIIAAFGRQDKSEPRERALYTVAHELAHADEHHRSGKQFAAQLIELHMRPNPFQIGRRAVWSEYYVCRKVAFADPAGLSTLEELLVRSTEEFSNDCASARARIAASNDKAGVHGRLCSSAFRFFIDAARLLGHLDGLGAEFKTACRIAPVYLDDAELASSLEDLHSKLNVLWESFPNWSGLDDLQSILVVIDTVLKRV
jgi:hypothetical protein